MEEVGGLLGWIPVGLDLRPQDFANIAGGVNCKYGCLIGAYAGIFEKSLLRGSRFHYIVALKGLQTLPFF